MVSHPCLFVFAVFGLRSTIAGEVKCKTLVDSRNAFLDCRIPCEDPTVIDFLKWTKNQSTLALYNGTSYTHTDRFGFRQPWNPSLQDISLQINNPTKKDSGEYNYTVQSDCNIFKGSVHLEIQDLTTISLEWNNDLTTTYPEQDYGSETQKETSSQVLPVVGILTAVLVFGIIVLWKKKKIPFSYTTSKTVEPDSNLPMENKALGNCTECRVEEGLLHT